MNLIRSLFLAIVMLCTIGEPAFANPTPLTTTLTAPSPGQTFSNMPSGTTYKADASGNVAGVLASDVPAMLRAGCTAQSGGGGGGGGATLPASGIPFATSTTTSRQAVSSDIQSVVGSGVYDASGAAAAAQAASDALGAATAATTPAAIATQIKTQTGCSTAGYVWVPASNTCVAQTGGGGAPGGTSGQLQTNNGSSGFSGVPLGFPGEYLGMNALGTAAQYVLPAPSFTTYQPIGDSITAGTGASVSSNAYVNLIAEDTGAVLSQWAQPGDTSCDQDQKNVFVRINPQAAPYHAALYTMMVGLNDAGQKGAGAYEPIYHLCHQAMMTWVAIPANYKTFGQACTQGGAAAWTADAGYVAGVATSNTTTGSTLACSITTTGGPVYLWYKAADAYTGSFTYQVDSGATTSVSTGTSGFGATISSANGAVSAPFVARITGVAAGTHTININVTGTTGANNVVDIIGVGTPAPSTLSSIDQPVLYSAGVSQLQGGSANATVYNADSLADQQLLAGDGLPIRFVDVRSLWGASEYSDGTHPNDAGHDHLRDSFERVMSYAPSTHGFYYSQFGTAAAPGISFQNAPNTGLFYTAGNTNLYFAVNGGQVGYIDPSGDLRFNGDLLVGNGTRFFPALTWGNQNSTGFYYTGSVECMATQTTANLCYYSNGGTSIGSYNATTAPANGMIMAGNLGLGTSSPSYPLDVVGATRATGYMATPATVTASTAPALVTSNGLQAITLPAASSVVPTITGIAAGQRVTFEICQPATGGVSTWTWPAAVHGGMTIGTTAGACSVQSFDSISGSTLVAENVGVQNVAP